MSALTRQDINDILALVDQSDFDELRLEIGDTKIELRRRGAGPSGTAAPVAEAPVAQAAPAPKPTEATPVAAPVVASGGGSEVPAPLLGTYYSAPKPGAAPFVKVGDRVEPDTVIGIIEVMKLMNSVTADVAGIVTAIHAEDGVLVEHGQALISVQPE
ncbi:acetyl-CoA carboxylase biotin carboxyl carrier protein [Celeribacter sp.]|uniref:acetyl-CoA carboxylase biotin carboxyl carrier protein n=1 Tax=Celeribacter sp. TaxID=1890673 RepID=UPI003A916E93